MSEDKANHTRSKSVLDVIFGNSVTDWNVSEGTLLKSIDFKIEQEKTKQQYYKLEGLNKTIELLKLATNANIPSSQISRLFGDLSPGSEESSRQSQSTNETKTIPATEFLSPNRNGTVPSSPTNDGVSLRAPVSYRFPANSNGGPPRPVRTHHRTNSPARIGAHAVANLNEVISVKEEPEPNNVLHPSSPLGRKSQLVSNHTRNYSEPSRFFTSSTTLNNITGPVTTVLDFEPHNKSGKGRQPRNSTDMLESDAHKLRNGSKRLGGITKRHRRTRSASSFGVIDLNIINDANSESLEKASINRMMEERKGRAPTLINDNDDRTCSESSSRTESPNRFSRRSSVTKLLNDP